MNRQERQHIVFLCGLLCDKLVWQSAAKLLEGEFVCSIVSFEGFNSIVDMAKAVADKGPASFILIGHSMGGRVALEVYRQCPERVEMLGLFNTGVHPRKEGEEAGRQKLLDIAATEGMAAVADSWLPPMVAGATLQNQSLMQALKEMVSRYSVEQFNDQIHALLQRPAVESLLAIINVPALLVSANEDKWSPVKQHKEMLKSIHGSELVVIHGAGHMAPVERPADVAMIIRDFISTIKH
ncbi:alpha/beta hydrolase [Haliea sp. AH-315-K21]|uniref:Alpha/beta hydrolase n=1 Tax=SAR86 cluster bacterium TaxID=2030880 RepID=A0A2A5CBF9_9GAMM|nr:alpha/beta hydrolase [Haliea sp. AH-315-K21]MBN4059775.1 alpha/beta hydrolase [bacterium AH-315-I11]MBN4075946.1 alpha/beta hydrolase [Gammaproteobacteria bacterium AH-315-E17]PCJ41152.1 MAG: alpha/beta hydrolase [SAR86 cluster bacterium]